MTDFFQKASVRAEQWRTWLGAPWSPEPVIAPWRVWRVLAAAVLLLWGLLRAGPLGWPLPPTDLPTQPLGEPDAPLQGKTDLAQSQADQALWVAALATPVPAAYQQLQALAGACGLQGEAHPAPVAALKQDLVWKGSWHAVASCLRRISQEVPSLWLSRLAMAAMPTGQVEVRLQFDTRMPTPTWPLPPVATEALLHDPFDEAALAQALRQYASQGPPAILRPRVSPWQALDPQALRLLGVWASPQGWQAVLGHRDQVFRVQTGDGLGWHHGRVTAIQADRVEIQEHVRGPDDAWQTRRRVLNFSGQSVQP